MSNALAADLVVIGAGAAGMMCAATAGQRGLRVVLIDHAPRVAEKIRISGGGRCNFTNLQAHRPECYGGAQPGFVRAALRAFPPERFIERVRAHGIAYHEKHKGQLFCDESAERIIAMLVHECERGRVQPWRPCEVRAVSALEVPPPRSGPRARFRVQTSAGVVDSAALVVATGGLSIPAIGASDLGYRLARQFGHRIVDPRPALVPLVFDSQAWSSLAALAGVALPVRIRSAESPVFDDDLLFTHRGLSGPAVLQASSFWRPGEALTIDLCAGASVARALFDWRQDGGGRTALTALSEWLPRRLAQVWCERASTPPGMRLAEVGNRGIERLAMALQRWQVSPTGTEGFRKAEVTVGGVRTEEIDPRSLQSRRVPGLYFVGEVLDVTGWLGGYNFQWAWSSGWLAGDAVGRGGDAL